MEKISMLPRRKDRIHKALGSVVSRRLAIPRTDLQNLKAQFAPSIKDALYFRGCDQEVTTTQPLRVYPFHHSPGPTYRALLYRPMSLVTHTYQGHQNFGVVDVHAATFRLWNEGDDGCAELKVSTDAAGNKEYKLRQTSPKNTRIAHAPYEPIDEAATVEILTDVLGQTKGNTVKPGMPYTLESISTALTQASPAVTIHQHGAYETYSGVHGSEDVPGDQGSATLHLTHFERLREGAHVHTDYEPSLQSWQPLSENGDAFVATRLAISRDPKARVPIATLQLGIEVAPGTEVSIPQRDRLFNGTIEQFSEPQVFIGAMRRHLAATVELL